jgi:hypothetical protein
VVIVIATRTDLRDRFEMADEAFALSPIGARATQPGEADYEAIREAFMETARGRWFLGEYAKRNRNADTSMVLDAVARIEETLAAQRPPELDDRLPEALAAIRSAVDDAAQVASTAIDGLGLDDSLAPIRKGARIVKEISWRWREIGADSRICDLIDSQVSAIEGSCGQISELDPRPAVNGAFDLIRTRIDAFSEEDAKDADPDDEKTVPPAADEVMETAVPAAAEPVARVIEAEPAAAGGVEIASAEAAPPQDTLPQEALPQEALPQDAPMTSAIAVVEVAGDVVATADARDETFLDETVLDEAVLGEVVLEDAVLDQTGPDQSVLDVTASDQAVLAEAAVDEAGLDEASLDEAVLDMVALAMAAPDPAGEMDYSIPDPDEIIEAPRHAAAMAISTPAPAAPHVPVAVAPAAPPPAPQSIGSALLANGFLEQHRTPANDPLAPIRRMSQAEKIAFFS